MCDQKICKFCHYWTPITEMNVDEKLKLGGIPVKRIDEPGDPRFDTIPVELDCDPFFGRCGHFGISYECPGSNAARVAYFVEHPDYMIFWDAEDYSASHLTGAFFGCVHWTACDDPKPKVQKRDEEED